MKLSKASDYALVFLAKLERLPKDHWVSVREMAQTLGIPNRFLSNIVHQLVLAGFLESQRGVHGGVKLAKKPEEITIGDILETMEDSMGLVDCVSQPGLCQIENHCDILKFWAVTHGLVLTALKQITLKDIIIFVYEGGKPPELKGEGLWEKSF